MRNKFIATLVAVILGVALGSCSGASQKGSGAEDSSSEQAQSIVQSSEAALSPDLVNPGWVVDSTNNIGGTSDLWYPNGDTSAYPRIYFTNAANDASLTVTFVNEGDHEDSVWDVELVDDHLKLKDGAKGEERNVDITFQDEFTCYDAVSGITFKRVGTSKEEAAKLFAGKVFVADKTNPAERKVAFADDGTVILTADGEDIHGTWTIVANNVASVHFESENDEWDDEWRLIVDADGKVTELDEDASTNLVLFDE